MRKQFYCSYDMPNIYGAQNFRFDPTSEAAIMTLVGADGINPSSSTNPAYVNSIEYVHAQTHAGRFFSGGYYNASVANGSSVDVLIQTGVQAFHAKFDLVASGDATVRLYENATFSAAGTGLTMSNHNRSSAKVFVGTVTHTPTVTGTGTQLNGTGYIPAGTKNQTVGGDFGFSNEFILKASTVYLARLTNDSGVAAKMQVSVAGYEPNL